MVVSMGILLAALSGIVVTYAPVSTIADMLLICLGISYLRWNFEVCAVEVRTVLAFDVTPVVDYSVLCDRWKNMPSYSVVVILPHVFFPFDPSVVHCLHRCRSDCPIVHSDEEVVYIFLGNVQSRCARIFVGLHRPDTFGIGRMGARGSRKSDHLSHVDNCVVPRLRYHIRI